MKGKFPAMLLKLDLEKAFDRLEWFFIRHALVYFNIPQSMISLIMSCVTTTSVSILINGSSTQYFTPSRGIHQGDPLPPYLFIMCMELLSRNISQSVDYLNWQHIRISNKGPLLSHLFFADDIILFSKITTKSSYAIIDVLNNFLECSGQKINFDKSKLFFSKNCSTNDKVLQ